MKADGGVRRLHVWKKPTVFGGVSTLFQESFAPRALSASSLVDVLLTHQIWCRSEWHVHAPIQCPPVIVSSRCATIYDVTRKETFTNLSEVWAKEIDLYSTNQDCIKMLVGNKLDKVDDLAYVGYFTCREC